MHPSEGSRKFGNAQDISTDTLAPMAREGECLRGAQWGLEGHMDRCGIHAGGLQHSPETLSERLAAVEKLHGGECRRGLRLTGARGDSMSKDAFL